MTRLLAWALLATLLFAPGLTAARGRDPLTSDEIDQLREAAVEPEKRLKLLADFARLRLTVIEETRTPKKPEAENARSLHDLMEDFLAVYDELDENIEMYEDRKSDLRKALKIVLLADGEFRARLDGLQHNLTSQEKTDCDFVLSSIMESVNSGTSEHRKLLAEQEASAKNKKKN